MACSWSLHRAGFSYLQARPPHAIEHCMWPGMTWRRCSPTLVYFAVGRLELPGTQGKTDLIRKLRNASPPWKCQFNLNGSTSTWSYKTHKYTEYRFKAHFSTQTSRKDSEGKRLLCITAEVVFSHSNFSFSDGFRGVWYPSQQKNISLSSSTWNQKYLNT